MEISSKADETGLQKENFNDCLNWLAIAISNLRTVFDKIRHSGCGDDGGFSRAPKLQ